MQVFTFTLPLLGPGVEMSLMHLRSDVISDHATHNITSSGS